ncbi:MAG: DNA mismatch repair protein MutS [Rhizobiales bacterium]|nr:DNA mismatch repair protein MutS [Hyphomicrobiales bacterium]
MAGIGGEAAGRASPVMAQYLAVKGHYPDCLLFYRMGDFYELFFADAEVASRDLGIALTKRGKHLGEDIPMCGVPVQAADGYLQRLIRKGHRVAVCEQMEDPAEARKRGSKAVVRRGVVRLVTPGTLTEEALLDQRSANYLAALSRLRATGEMALAWADISSGELAVTETAPDRLAADLARIGASEIIVADTLLEDQGIAGVLAQSGAAITPATASRFDSAAGERRLIQHFGVASLEGFGNFGRAETASLGGLLDYIMLTQVGRLPHLRPPRREAASASLLIDMASRNNLELSRTLSGERRGSLLGVIDLTVTAAGARLLAERLASPLAELSGIARRLDAVEFLVNQGGLRSELRQVLTRLPDTERALARLYLGRGGPRDLAAIRDGLAGAAELARLIDGTTDLAGLAAEVGEHRDGLAGGDANLAGMLEKALADELPHLARDGSFVRPGYMAELDQNRSLRDETQRVIAGLQATYAEKTGIKSLKIRHNNVLGYFIEVTAQNAAQLQAPEQAAIFIHRQTVASAMRFVTTELAMLEARIAAAADRALAIEMEIFGKLVAEVTARSDPLSKAAQAAAALDVMASLAELAVRRRYVRPRVDHSTAFEIAGGRHAVVEAMLQEEAVQSFVANDCDLSGRRLWLLTGPNMAGKSTFLRQNALIVILAQMGSFVPAQSAHIGIVDRLFSRVGAADDLARGRSTFMVEMVETAAILNQASHRSFVILDEIGRGTATYDGLSIAWASVEHLHEANRCRALFATHYHELTALAAKLDHLATATVKVREWQGEVIFLHEVAPGVADRSYGIQVAKLAGLPPAVIARASEVLQRLEATGARTPPAALASDLPLFQAARPVPISESATEKKLAAIRPDELSPREALNLIYELKTLVADKR